MCIRLCSFFFHGFLFQEDDDDVVSFLISRATLRSSLSIFTLVPKRFFFTHKLSLSSHLFCGVVFLSLVNLERLIEIIFCSNLFFYVQNFIVTRTNVHESCCVELCVVCTASIQNIQQLLLKL